MNSTFVTEGMVIYIQTALPLITELFVFPVRMVSTYNCESVMLQKRIKYTQDKIKMCSRSETQTPIMIPPLAQITANPIFVSITNFVTFLTCFYI